MKSYIELLKWLYIFLKDKEESARRFSELACTEYTGAGDALGPDLTMLLQIFICYFGYQLEVNVIGTNLLGNFLIANTQFSKLNVLFTENGFRVFLGDVINKINYIDKEAEVIVHRLLEF